jgi:hypothetical protein
MPVQPTKETDQKKLQTERRYISEIAEKSSQQQFVPHSRCNKLVREIHLILALPPPIQMERR